MGQDPRATEILQRGNHQLVEENKRLKAELTQVRGVIFQRGNILMGEMIDAFNLMAQAAMQGDMGAKQQATNFLQALQNLQVAAGKIIVVKGNH